MKRRYFFSALSVLLTGPLLAANNTIPSAKPTPVSTSPRPHPSPVTPSSPATTPPASQAPLRGAQLADEEIDQQVAVAQANLPKRIKYWTDRYTAHQAFDEQMKNDRLAFINKWVPEQINFLNSLKTMPGKDRGQAWKNYWAQRTAEAKAFDQAEGTKQKALNEKEAADYKAFNQEIGESQTALQQEIKQENQAAYPQHAAPAATKPVGSTTH